MAHNPFNKSKSGELFKFHSTSDAFSGGADISIPFAKDGSDDFLYNYLGIADFLAGSLMKFAIVSQEINKHIPGKQLHSSGWRYFLTNDDWAGSDYDTGWISVNGSRETPYNIWAIESFLALEKLNNMSPDEHSLQCILFALGRKRGNELVQFLNETRYPELSYFLQEGDLFINIVIGKRRGFFHSMVIKTKTDQTQNINRFQYATDSDG